MAVLVAVQIYTIPDELGIAHYLPVAACLSRAHGESQPFHLQFHIALSKYLPPTSPTSGPLTQHQRPCTLSHRDSARAESRRHSKALVCISHDAICTPRADRDRQLAFLGFFRELGTPNTDLRAESPAFS